MFFYLLLLIFTPLFIWLSFKKPILSLSLIVFALPSYLIRFQIWFIPMTFLELMILILFSVWLFKTICASRSKIQSPGPRAQSSKPNWKWLIIIWLIISLVAVVISPNKLAALGIWKAYFIEPILFFLVFISEVKKQNELNLILYSLGLGALIVSLIAIYQRFTGWLVPDNYWLLGEGKRVTSVFGYPNAIGLYLGAIIGLFVGKIVKFSKNSLSQIPNPQSPIPKLLYCYTVILLSLLAIILARSEGAIIGIIFSLIVFGLVIKEFRLKTLAIVLVLIILILTIPFFKNFIFQKIQFKDWSNQTRLSIWKESWQMLKDNWFWGVGLAGYQTKFLPYHQAKYIEIFLYPHNIILNFWAELGILGLLTFFGLLINFFREIRKKLKCPLLFDPLRRSFSEAREGIKGWWELENKSYLYGSLIAMLIILIHGLVDVSYFKNDLAVLFWLVMGICYIV